jgi:hypothetical protein
MADWAKIETTELLIHLDKQKTPPPLTGEHINNNLVWFLAFAPILGYFLEWFVAGFVSGATGSCDYATEMAMADAKYWYVTIILNIALSYADELQLRKAGHNTDKFKGLVWLVPVYLYQRAQATKQNLVYFIVWIVSFILIISI